MNDIKDFLSPEVIDNCIHNDESCAVWCKWCYQVKRFMIFVKLETYSTLQTTKLATQGVTHHTKNYKDGGWIQQQVAVHLRIL